MIEINIEKRIKTYKGWVNLKINTRLETPGITRIAGPSGAGKTTLLKILAGLITPESGTILVENELWFDAAKGHSKKIQERHVGFVFQDYALFPNMTVEAHLKYGTSDQKYINELLQIGEMEAFRKNFPEQLSGGQQQRLAILRALSTKPKLLLMDESLSALDLEMKMKLLDQLQSLFLAQKTTVLMVTHDESEIAGSSASFYIPD